MKYCPKCRTEYRDEISACADCGAGLTSLPPPQEPERPAVENTQVFSAVYVDEAYFVRSLLESAGLHPSMTDEYTVSVNPFFSNAIGNIKIFVPEDEALDAKLIVDEYINNRK